MTLAPPPMVISFPAVMEEPKSELLAIAPAIPPAYLPMNEPNLSVRNFLAISEMSPCPPVITLTLSLFTAVSVAVFSVTESVAFRLLPCTILKIPSILRRLLFSGINEVPKSPRTPSKTVPTFIVWLPVFSSVIFVPLMVLPSINAFAGPSINTSPFSAVTVGRPPDALITNAQNGPATEPTTALYPFVVDIVISPVVAVTLGFVSDNI